MIPNASNNFAPESSGAQIVTGTVGWEGDAEFVDFGTDENKGYTFVKVQLFDGMRDTTKPLTPELGQGTKIICHLSGSLFRIPKKGTRVFVAIPDGMENVTGAGVIFATIEKSPTSQFAKDRVVVDYGSDVHVVIRGKSVALQSTENDFVSVGTPRSGGAAGVTISCSSGTGAVFQAKVASLFVASGGAAKTCLQMTDSHVECMSDSGGMWKLDGDFYTLGANVTLAGGAVYLGKTPNAASPALWGPTGIAGVASTSVFISPI